MRDLPCALWSLLGIAMQVVPAPSEGYQDVGPTCVLLLTPLMAVSCTVRQPPAVTRRHWCLQAAKTEGPPHTFASAGSYSGWLWTVPATNYDRREALANWPPATEGLKAFAMKWYGSIRRGRLFLARQTTLEDSDVVPVVEILLRGCQVTVVSEGLR